MKKLFVIIPLMALLLSCSSFYKLRTEVQNIDDAVVKAAMAKVEDLLREKAREAEENIKAEVKDNKDLAAKVENKILKKSYERLEPIISEAMKEIEPIVVKASKEIQAQVREEILEELTGEEINEECPDCKDKKETPEVAPDKTVPDDAADKPAEETPEEPAEATEAPEKPADEEEAGTQEKPVEEKAEESTKVAEPVKTEEAKAEE